MKEGGVEVRHMEKHVLFYLGEQQVSCQLCNSEAALLLKVRLSRADFFKQTKIFFMK